MKALTLTQPWATLVAVGAKKIETRSWATPYRGLLAIHAAKGFPAYAKDACIMAPISSTLGKAGYNRLIGKRFENRFDLKEMPLGAIVATCVLVDCIQIKPLNQYVHLVVPRPNYNELIVRVPPNEPELSFGDYTPGRYAWVLDNIKPLPEPIPAKGALGLWDWDGQQ